MRTIMQYRQLLVLSESLQEIKNTFIRDDNFKLKVLPASKNTNPNTKFLF